MFEKLGRNTSVVAVNKNIQFEQDIAGKINQWSGFDQFFSQSTSSRFCTFFRVRCSFQPLPKQNGDVGLALPEKKT